MWALIYGSVHKYYLGEGEGEGGGVIWDVMAVRLMRTGCLPPPAIHIFTVDILSRVINNYQWWGLKLLEA